MALIAPSILAMEKIIKEGADIVVTGTSLFQTENPQDTLMRMKELTQRIKHS